MEEKMTSSGFLETWPAWINVRWLKILLLAALRIAGPAATLQRFSKRSISTQPSPLHSLIPAAQLQG